MTVRKIILVLCVFIYGCGTTYPSFKNSEDPLYIYFDEPVDPTNCTNRSVPWFVPMGKGNHKSITQVKFKDKELYLFEMYTYSDNERGSLIKSADPASAAARHLYYLAVDRLGDVEPMLFTPLRNDKVLTADFIKPCLKTIQLKNENQIALEQMRAEQAAKNAQKKRQEEQQKEMEYMVSEKGVGGQVCRINLYSSPVISYKGFIEGYANGKIKIRVGFCSYPHMSAIKCEIPERIVWDAPNNWHLCE